jgi:hypothetical protein
MSAEIEKFFELPQLPEEQTSANSSINDEPFKDFLEEVDHLLVNLTPEELEVFPDPNQTPANIEETLHFSHPGALTAEQESGLSEMQTTFLAIMQQVLRPVARYVKAIGQGEESRELFEVMNFTVAPLVHQVEQVQLYKHTADLLLFRGALTRILSTHFGTLSTELRQQLLHSFNEVKTTFNLTQRGNLRAVQNLLNFYRMLCFSQEVDVEQIRKFFAIGIPSLTWVRRSSAHEISSLSGMDLKHAKLLKKMALSFREIEENEEL